MRNFSRKYFLKKKQTKECGDHNRRYCNVCAGCFDTAFQSWYGDGKGIEFYPNTGKGSEFYPKWLGYDDEKRLGM